MATNSKSRKYNFIMWELWTVVIVCIILDRISKSQLTELNIPENLLIGAGSASYQVEGAWNVSDKGLGIWDSWTHNNPELISDSSNGDVACNAYRKYQEDVQLIKSLGLDFYRFSISPSRILPNGFTNVVSQEGLEYYKNLTAELVKNGIRPVVTIHHFDHPQILEDMGGWTNEIIVDWFVAYARILFEALGEHVKTWTTINEPVSLCSYGYGKTFIQLAPGKDLSDVGLYLCGHNVLKAHALTYRMYDKEFRATQKGEVGIVLPCMGYVAKNSRDTISTETAYQFSCGWFAHPIYKGDYPKIMKTRIAMMSKARGYATSRLPKFSKQWISIIRGTNDYFGVNHYTTFVVSPDPDESLGIYKNDNGLIFDYNTDWPNTSVDWFRVHSEGFGDMLRWISDEYDNPPVWVMENGIPDTGGLVDYDRINYHRSYMSELLKAINRDDCNIRAYGIWSLMDDFEWDSGYSQKFGILGVDFNDPNRTRTPKLSATWWKSTIENRKLQDIPINNL